MKQSNLGIRILSITILGILLLILIPRTCSNDKYQQLKGEYKLLKDQYNKQQDKIKEFEINRIKQKDSLNLEIKIREDENKKLSSLSLNLTNEINTLKERKVNTPVDIPGLVEYFNNRYETTTTQAIGDRIGITQIIGHNISTELEEGDNYAKIIPLQDEQIKNQEKQINNLNKDKSDIKIQLSSAEEEILQRKSLEESANKNINNLEKQVKTLNKKNTFTTILVPVAFFTGGFIGYQIAK